MRVGLVLGGGGMFGLAYHAGVLAALANDLRWDPRDAEVVVGTSAGSIIGALLRAGVPAHDLAASMVGADLLETPASIAAALVDRSAPPALTRRDLMRLPRLPEFGVVARLARPWAVDPVAAAVSVIPDGRADVFHHVALLRALPQRWPSRPLWITGMRQNDLRRVVFGRADQPRPALGDAIGASCAVPGYFAPVDIVGVRYVDGGVRSPTNADVLDDPEVVDFVVIVSAMSSSGGRPPAGQLALRRYADRKVRAEQGRLAAAGVPSVVLAPGPDVTRPFGAGLMAQDRLRELTCAAFFDTGRQLADLALPPGLGRGLVRGTSR